ncbi:hypothetical protein AB0O07_00625 [Streptomyces sp. NPDC093085]|uniref:hypothetical protein n=1 Tax=Streptomyces sp. NPDC093085 TaxID=3155068 RepID=UPI0034124BC4
MKDRWGFDVSTDAGGVELWNEAVEARLREDPDAADMAQALVEHAPQLGVARALAATVARDHASDPHGGQSDAGLRRAFHDGRGASGRESSLIRILHLRHLRRTSEMANQLVLHLALYPADPLTSRLLYSTLLTRTEPEQRVWIAAQIERQAAVAHNDSWPWMSALAFLRAEQHRCDEAASLALRALAIEPRCASAAHVLMHVHYDTGAATAGLAWIDNWLTTHPRTPRKRHFQWHAALHALAAGDTEEARRRTADELLARDVAAVSSLNWRLLLVGEETTRAIDAEAGRALLKDERRAMATVWNAFHIALALAAAGDADGLGLLARQARGQAQSGFTEVLAPIADALALLLRGSPARAAELLTSLRDRIWLLGLTGIESEIVEDTLARALTADGRCDEAAALLHHRMDTRTSCAYERMLCTTLA